MHIIGAAQEWLHCGLRSARPHNSYFVSGAGAFINFVMVAQIVAYGKKKKQLKKD